MSSDIAVKLGNVSKCYQSYQKPVHRLVQAFFGQRRKLYSEFWALQEIDLEVERGETLGILGKNGSGKSTLLQIIAGTLTPTSGEVSVRGRVSAILELGAGFNPEFTGVENARLNAAIMGVPSVELDDRLPGIIEFSELGDFIHQPVKTYSSGMYVRLAFSVAINMRPEVLIIDEALAVGDLRFQRKCFRKLERLRNDGVTILFVTHATGSVVAHCDRALFLDGGMVQAQGEPKDVVNLYLESLFHHETPPAAATVDAPDATGPAELAVDAVTDLCGQRPTYNPTEYRWGDRHAEIVDYLILDQDGKEVRSTCRCGDTIRIRMAVYFSRTVTQPVFGLTVKTVDGTAVYGTNTLLQETVANPAEAGTHAVVVFTVKLNLLAAEYFVSLGVVSLEDGSLEVVHDRRYDLFQIKLQDDGDAFGLAALEGSIQHEFV